MGKSSPAPPPAPDYAGAAQQTAAGNKENTIAAQQGSMVNQYTPYGNLTYGAGPDTAEGNPTYNANYDLSPTGQSLLNAGNESALGVAGLQSGAMGRTAQTLDQPFDQSSVQDTADRAYKAYTDRLDPQWDQRAEQNRTQLANQGLTSGGEAYTNQMRDFNNSRNDAYTQANLASIGTMPQSFQLANALRNQPLNELNALRTGSQVTNPTFSAQPGQQVAPGANYSQAAGQQGAWDQGLYNAGVGSANSMNSGLMSLAGAGLGAYGTYAGLAAMSDRRLKSNIVRIGAHPLGIGIYEYDIFGHRDIGVMAQEVMDVQPEAVLMHPSGYMMVDYGRLNA